jgi:hypothetical protein
MGTGNAGGGGEAASPREADPRQDNPNNLPDNPNNLPDRPGYDPDKPTTYVNEDATEEPPKKASK